MKYDDFKKLGASIKKKDFASNYRGFSKLIYAISYVGNAFSILFAYFFINQIIMATVLNPSPAISITISVVSVGLLAILELLKRFIFDKFSQASIKEKLQFKNGETIVLGLISIFLITASFYFSLNGAEHYADKKDDIKQTTEIQVDSFSDSLDKKYEYKIVALEEQNKKIFETNQINEQKITDLSEQSRDALLTRAEQKRAEKEMVQLRKDKISNNQAIDKNESRIKTIKEEKDAEIAKFEKKKNSKADNLIEKNSGTPFIFFVFSTVIEFFILLGIWFLNYYQIRSYGEYETLMNKDLKYKTFSKWMDTLDLLYNSDTKIGDNLPFKTELAKLYRANNIDMSVKETDDMFRVMTNKKIFRQKGNRRAFLCSKEDAVASLKEHFKID